MITFALLLTLFALAVAISARQAASRRADALEQYAQDVWREADRRTRELTERVEALERSHTSQLHDEEDYADVPGEAQEPPAPLMPTPPFAVADPDASTADLPDEIDSSGDETHSDAAFAAGDRSWDVAPEQQAPPAGASPARPTLSEKIRGFDWESLVGVKLFSWIAGIALVIGGVLFLRYSIDHGWLIPPVRMALGFATGAGLLLVCELRLANRYRITANAMDGAGIALLYATTYASHALWQLVGGGLAAALMIAITIVAVFLSIRRDSAFIALLGMIGGFSTPALLSSGENRPVVLFSYLLLVNAGVAWVAHRKGWRWLSLLSVAFTVFYQWAWVEKFLEPTQLPLAATIFLVFPIFTVVVYLFTTRSDEIGGGGAQRFAASASAVVPLLFTVYVAVVPAYGARFHLLFAVLLIVRAGLAVISLRRPALVPVHRVGSITSLAVMLLWLNASWTAAAWPDLIGWLVALLAIDVLIPVVRELRGSTLDPSTRQAAVLGTLLLAAYPILARIEPRTSNAVVFFGSLFVLALLLTAAAHILRQKAIYVVVAIAAFTAQWQWGSEFLTRLPGQALVAWTAFGALFLLAPAIPSFLVRRHGDDGTPGASHDGGIIPHLGLPSYLLLFAIAARPELMSQVGLITALAVLLVASVLASQLSLRASLLAPSLVGTNIVLVIAIVAGSFSRIGGSATYPLAAAILTAAAGLFTARLHRHSEGARGFQTMALAGLFSAEATLIVASMVESPPPLPFLALAHAAILSAILRVAASSRRHRVAVAAAAVSALPPSVWLLAQSPSSGWGLDLALGFAALLPFLVYPFAAANSIGSRTAPYVAPIAASAWFFFYARQVMVEGGLESVIGLLPVLLAAAVGLVLRQLIRTRASDETASTRLALVAGTVLAFLTVAIPLQFDREWVTLGWLLEAAALAWLFTRVPHHGLLLWSSGLYAAGFTRLVITGEVYGYYERSGTPIFNWYLYAYLLGALAFFVGHRVLRNALDHPVASAMRRVLPAGGTILLFVLLNIEIADYFSTGARITFRLSQSLGQDLTYTIAWALFAIGMLIVGIAVQKRGARVASIGLLVATILKCFLHDLAQLGGLYRIGAFVGLAVSLAAVALLLQRFVLRRPAVAGEQ